MADRFPVPDAALDDRLGFLGTAGAGKTYNAQTAFLRVLDRRGRGIWVDPLGVAWGMRLSADGKTPSPYPIVIFGGPHGDLPLNEHAGKLIGEAVAGMRESAIVDLSQLATRSAERRFMLAFLETMYRKAGGEPFHLVLDEADLWAPQKASEPQLQALTEQIVRRGRVKGFIPWLITQRPAVLSKDVLSQVDGLVMLKLTSPQDRDAIGAWIEGQADRKEWYGIRAELPTLQRGQAVVWIPGRAVLERANFPPKPTFDSSASPTRGKRGTAAPAMLAALDVGALRERLATVEAEQKATDPRHLKARIAELEQQLKAKGADPATIAAAEARGAERERKSIPAQIAEVERHVREAIAVEVMARVGVMEGVADRLAELAKALREEAKMLAQAARHGAARASGDKKAKFSDSGAPERVQPNPKISAVRHPPSPTASEVAPKLNVPPHGAVVGLTGPQAQLLKALAWWRAMGHDAPSRPQVAGIAGWKITSGHLKNVVGSLRTAGLVSYPAEGRIAMTPAGAAAAPEPDLSVTLHDGIRSVLTGPQRQIFDVLVQHGGGPLERTAIAAALGWEPTSGHLKNVVGSLRTLEVVAYPGAGAVALQDWVMA